MTPAALNIGQTVYDEWGREWRIHDFDEGGKLQLRRPDPRWGHVDALCRPDEVTTTREARESEDS